MSIRCGNTSGYLLLLLIAGVYVTIYYLVPLQLDDWTFMAEWRNVGGEDGFSLSKLYDYWQIIREGDNGRISNTLAPFSTSISPWQHIYPLLTGIATAFVVMMTCRFAFGRRLGSQFLSLALVWTLMIYLLPWRDRIFVKDFSLNYVWGSLVTLVFVSGMLSTLKRGWSPLRLIAMLFMAILAGGWHEGFSASTAFGLVLFMMYRRFRLPWQWWIVGVVYVASLLFFFISPGMFSRISRDAGVVRADVTMVRMLADFVPVILMLILVAGLSCARSGRILLRSCIRRPIFIVSAGIVLAGTIISLYFNHSPRSAFWPDLTAIIMILSMARTMINRLQLSNRRYYVDTLLMCVCAVPMVTTIIWQHAFYTEAEEIMHEMKKSKTGTVYRDVIPTSAVPNYTLRMPTRSHWVTPFHYKCIREYTGLSFPAVVPPELREEGYYSGRRLGGNAAAVKVEDAILLPPDYPADLSPIPVEVGDSALHKQAIIGFAFPYINAKGERNVYFLPLRVDPCEIEYMKFE